MAAAWLLAVLLACTTVPWGAPVAVADPASDAQAAVDQAQSALDAAESRMAEINEEYEALSAEVDELQKRIDKTAKKALKAQQAMLEGREALGDVAVGEYREGNLVSLLGVVLDSKNFDDLLRNMEYVNQIMSYQADEIAKQKERKQKFDEVSAELNEQKNDQEQALAAQAAKRDEAEAVVADATSQLSDAKADQAARLAELARQAEELRKQQEASEQEAAAEEDPNANTIDREDVVSDDEPVADNPDPDAPGQGGSSGDDSASDNTPADKPEQPSKPAEDSNEGWQTGVASAYGGKTDPSTPNPGTTATGAVCDDNSMGVAVPMSLSGYRKLFGRTVEISYGGKTVYATVNDCGGLGGGSRALDLQPGVWKAFGFSSCKAWGLRTVSYRFL